MRPPQKTGEKQEEAGGNTLLIGRFNEAPAKNGGKGGYDARVDPGLFCFNEAPAKNGGKAST